MDPKKVSRAEETARGCRHGSVAWNALRCLAVATWDCGTPHLLYRQQYRLPHGSIALSHGVSKHHGKPAHEIPGAVPVETRRVCAVHGLEGCGQLGAGNERHDLHIPEGQASVAASGDGTRAGGSPSYCNRTRGVEQTSGCVAATSTAEAKKPMALCHIEVVMASQAAWFCRMEDRVLMAASANSFRPATCERIKVA